MKTVLLAANKMSRNIATVMHTLVRIKRELRTESSRTLADTVWDPIRPQDSFSSFVRSLLNIPENGLMAMVPFDPQHELRRTSPQKSHSLLPDSSSFTTRLTIFFGSCMNAWQRFLGAPSTCRENTVKTHVKNGYEKRVRWITVSQQGKLERRVQQQAGQKAQQCEHQWRR